MPIYVYKSKDAKKSCDYCKVQFEITQSIKEAALKECPHCKAEIKRIILPFNHGFSQTNFDRRAKEKGMHKLKKVDKGKYEKLY